MYYTNNGRIIHVLKCSSRYQLTSGIITYSHQPIETTEGEQTTRGEAQR